MKMLKAKRTQKIVSLVLALALLISTVIVGGVTASATETAPEIWDGWTTKVPVDSDSDGVYEISNGAELAYVVKNGGQGLNYVLTNDIYLNDKNAVDWLNGTVNSGYSPTTWYGNWNATAFTGTIDGQGHTVYGIYYEMEAGKSYSAYAAGVGLIPEATNATVKNLGVDYSYIHHETTASGLVAVASENSIVNLDSCYVGENVYLKSYTEGALRGYARNSAGGVIQNCYSLAILAATTGDGVGTYTGLVAEIWENGAKKLTISNCYNAKGSVSSHANTTYNTIRINNFETVASGDADGSTVLTAANMQGIDALTSASKMSTLNKL